MDYLKEKRTNLLFRLGFASLPLVSEKFPELILLGRKYKLEQGADPEVINRQISEQLEKVPWFCYRKNFDRISTDLQDYQLTSDAGWGCMIRVGQNMFFVILDEFLCSQREDGDIYLLKKFF